MGLPLRPDDASRTPLLGRPGDPLRFELDLQEGVALESCEDPFVALGDSGRLARVVLGRLVSGEGTLLKPLAVKLQRSYYRPLAGGAGKDPLTNPMIEERWRREREALAKCAGGSLVPLIDLGPAGFSSRPVTFCKKTRAYFHPPCPRCGALLEDCRDDGLLHEHGLPEYSRSATRYLYCKACASFEEAGLGLRIFYTTAPAGEDAPKGDANVRRRGELYRDLGALVNASRTDEERAALSRSFPCAGCPHRETCFPLPGEAPAGKAVPAEGLLFPVSYYDFHLLAFEVMELHLDEFGDLLGGASWAALRDRVRQAGSAGRERTLQAVDAHYTGPVQWLYQDDTIERFALEVLHLKLALFSQLCRGVREYHEKVREPHLHLSPSQVMVDVLPGATNLPARWSFQVRLIGASGPHRFEPQGLRAGLPVPAPDADKIFLSPFVRGAEFGREESLRVSIRSLQPEGDQLKVEGVASSERARLETWQPGDVIRVVPTGGALEGTTLWGTLEWREDQGVKFSALVPAGAVPDPARKPADFDAGVACFPRFGVACDLYSLGLLLFRSLLVNDQTTLIEADAALQRVLRRVSVWSEGKRSPAAARVASELLAQIGQEPDVFQPGALLHSEDDRNEAAKALPPRLWSDLLLFGFKLTTSIPGFSFATGHADSVPDHPEGLMDAVRAELSQLEARVRIELFARAERDREIGEVCDELLAELSGPPKAGAP